MPHAAAAIPSRNAYEAQAFAWHGTPASVQPLASPLPNHARTRAEASSTTPATRLITWPHRASSFQSGISAGLSKQQNFEQALRK